MSARELLIVTEDYDRIRPISDGIVGIPGFTLRVQFMTPMQTFARMFTTADLDVAEMSFSSYLVALSRGDFPYVGIPVFPSRVFAHSSIYVRADRIREPADLRGKTVGVPNYQFTRGLCARGLLQDEYGLAPGEMTWVVGGVDRPQDLDYMRIQAPPGVSIAPLGQGQTLSAALAAGEIDAVITASTPGCWRRREANVARLFPDFRSAERDYYRRTGFFPIMHLVGVRRALLDESPELARNLVTAFTHAKQMATPALTELDALAVQLPWLVAEAEETMALMGEDFWPYGLDRNRAMLEAQIRWSHTQGLASRRFAVEELFHPSTL